MYRTSTCITFVWTHVHRDNGFSEVGQKKANGRNAYCLRWEVFIERTPLNRGKMLNDP